MSDTVQGQDTTQVNATPGTATVSDTVNQVLAAKNEATINGGKPETAPEVKPEPKVEDKPEDKRTAAKFAALSKQDKAIKAREKAVEARAKEIEAKFAELEGKKAPETPKEDVKVRMRRDPFTTLKEEYGLDLTALTEIARNEGKLTPDMELRLRVEEAERRAETRVEALERQLKEKEDKATEAAQSAREAAAIAEFKGSISAYVKSDPVAYEMLAHEGTEGEQLIFDVINGHYETTAAQAEDGIGKILSVKEAADHVESALLEQAKAYTGLSKIKSLFGAPVAAKDTANATAGKGAPPTLSNEQASTAPAKKTSKTREEEFAEAVKMIRYQQQ